ncbi:cystathione beta-lyase [Parelusimicrobium proximum]|uniref:MalY/PatB family protein n=1 Tax=Parelusimicrobium proximum TaxID=3228953 RepID=UPI003D18267A
MKYDFDTVFGRLGTGSIKYNMKGLGKPEDVIPMWVADMDFKTAPAITQALEQTARQGIYGYTYADSEYDMALCNWYKTRFAWPVMPGWNVQVPSVIFAIFAAVKALTKERDSVIICQPVYHPFENIIKASGRNLVVSELQYITGKYQIDFEDFEQQIIKNNVKMFILCSPHNPIGRVWTKDELAKLGEICLRHNVYIISDEIHSDLVLSGHKHTPLASISDDIANITLTCTAPTKTFNLAGIQASNIIIKNAEIKEKFIKERDNTGFHALNMMAIAATHAAYTQGGEWLSELLKYLEANVKFLSDTLARLNCGVSLVKPEGTYLMWLDCRALGLSDDALDTFFTNKAKLWLNRGDMFGLGGSGFMRMNIACPCETMKLAMERLERAVK